MSIVIVYESMYGNTREIAQAIAAGVIDASGHADVHVLPVGAVDAAALEGAQLLVIGGPTHTFGMSRPSTRATAVDAAHKPGATVVAEPGAGGPGLREWLDTLSGPPVPVAVFDTRVKGIGFAGHAARSIGRVVAARGYSMPVPPESFWVQKDNRLRGGELDGARRWGRVLAALPLTSVTKSDH